MPNDYVKIEANISAADAARLHRVSREMEVPWEEVIRRGLGFYLDAVDEERE